MNKHLTNPDIKRYTITFWKIIIGCIAFGIIFIFSVGLGLFGKLPSFRDLENPKSNQASEVISEDGNVLGTYYIQNRSTIRYDEISPNVINALVATEDKRFYNHSGIDYKRTFTIILKNLIGKKEGASTITQQLALNLFSKEGRAKDFLKRVIQKFQEWITAVKLERQYTKEEILAMYLNTVDWGSYNTFGIKSAARTYFNTTPDKLRPEQAAVLIGMLKGPSYYSPIRYPERALSRRNVVLENMRNVGYLSDEEASKLKKEPMKLYFNPSDYAEGLAPYFRAILKKEIQKLFINQAIYKADGTAYDLDRDGLKIYTTLDSRMQKYAEDAQKEYLKELQHQFNTQSKWRDPFKIKDAKTILELGIKRSDRYRQLQEDGASDEEIEKDFNTPVKMNIFSWKGNIDTLMKPIDSIKYTKLLLRNSIMSMEPETGHVKVWVGGTSFEHFKYDQVKVGTRQVGSTAKPFTYAAAIERGYSPCYKLPNEAINIDGWVPSGGSSPLQGYLTLKTALAHSQNFVTARLMDEIGATAVATLTKKMGITTDVPAYPSICLGTFDASLYDMVGAYSTFVNQGVWRSPQYLLRIEDKNGALIYQHNTVPKVVLNPEVAYVMTNMLKGVVNEGTGRRVKWKYHLMNPIGGKTGTTQNSSDGWWMGITPQLVTGIWTGFEDRAIHFTSTNQGDGANSALPVFALFMKKVYANPALKYTKGDFEVPKGGVKTVLDCGEYYKPDSSQTALDEKLGF